MANSMTITPHAHTNSTHGKKQEELKTLSFEKDTSKRTRGRKSATQLPVDENSELAPSFSVEAGHLV